VKNLVKEVGPNYKVLNTGHSLGAALSAISSVELARAGIPGDNIELVNFGQPRVGNAAFSTFANKLVKRRYRVVNMKVPRRSIFISCPR
jgi:predicted lipase